jgi:4-hydroxybenzoate polyprenyltransferase
VLAGADPATALRLGLSMTALQVAIGTLNDVVDAPDDARSKPAKPIPSALVSLRSARFVLVLAAVIGLILAATSGPWLVGLALVVLGIGAAYDLRAKGTAWSWVPFAVGIPILPLYGWLGTTGSVAPWFAALVPMGMLVGAGLAVANARADRERDIAAGVDSVAVALGDRASWLVNITVIALALWLALASLPSTGEGTTVVTTVTMVLGSTVLLVGLVAGRSGAAGRRERGWQAQAVGVGLVAVGWIAAVASG